MNGCPRSGRRAESCVRGVVRVLLLVLLLLAAHPPISRAHPHVFIDATATLLFRDGRVHGVMTTWRFDPIFSHAIIHDFDHDGDGRLSQVEVAAIEQGAFQNIRQFGFFTHFRVGGEAVPVARIVGFDAFVEEGQLVYSFSALLENPVDPLRRPVELGMYDATYYVDIRLRDDEPIWISGASHGDCPPERYRDTDNRIYFGSVAPEMIRIHCARG